LFLVIKKKMKIQDIIFLVLLVILLFKPQRKFFCGFWVRLFLLAIPFFYLYIFLYSGKTVYYGALLVLVEVLFKLIQFGIKPRK